MQEKRVHQTFHVGLKAFIADGEKLLILQDDEGLWELPGGRTEKSEIHEDLRNILKREVTEEVGEAIQYDIGPISHAWIRKPDPILGKKTQYSDNDFCIFLVGFQCTYKKGGIQLSPEHQTFKWITKEEVYGIDFENTYKDAIKQYFQMFEK